MSLSQAPVDEISIQCNIFMVKTGSSRQTVNQVSAWRTHRACLSWPKVCGIIAFPLIILIFKKIIKMSISKFYQNLGVAFNISLVEQMNRLLFYQ